MAADSVGAIGAVSAVLGQALSPGGMARAAVSSAPSGAGKAQAFQDAMRRVEAGTSRVAAPDPGMRAGRAEAVYSPVMDAFVESIKKRDAKLKTVFTGDPSRPETVVDALNFMHRHQTALLEFHAVLQVAENLKNGINKLTNMQ